MFSCPGASDGGVVFGRLPGVVSAEGGGSCLSAVFVEGVADIAGGSVGLIGSEAGEVCVELCGELRGRVDSADGTTEVFGVVGVEFR